MVQHVNTPNTGTPFIRVEKSGEDRHCSRLSGAVRSEEGKNGPLRDIDVEPVEGDYVAVLLDKTACFND
jgi:hypothetical protein